MGAPLSINSAVAFCRFSILLTILIGKVNSQRKERIMTRKYIDCREFPSATKCSVALSADSDQELLEAAVQHAVSVHQHKDTPELREQLKQLFKEGTPQA